MIYLYTSGGKREWDCGCMGEMTEEEVFRGVAEAIAVATRGVGYPSYMQGPVTNDKKRIWLDELFDMVEYHSDLIAARFQRKTLGLLKKKHLEFFEDGSYERRYEELEALLQSK